MQETDRVSSVVVNARKDVEKAVLENKPTKKCGKGKPAVEAQLAFLKEMQEAKEF